MWCYEILYLSVSPSIVPHRYLGGICLSLTCAAASDPEYSIPDTCSPAASVGYCVDDAYFFAPLALQPQAWATQALVSDSPRKDRLDCAGVSNRTSLQWRAVSKQTQEQQGPTFFAVGQC